VRRPVVPPPRGGLGVRSPGLRLHGDHCPASGRRLEGILTAVVLRGW
jgi:hypothetical protein